MWKFRNRLHLFNKKENYLGTAIVESTMLTEHRMRDQVMPGVHPQRVVVRADLGVGLTFPLDVIED